MKFGRELLRLFQRPVSAPELVMPEQDLECRNDHIRDEVGSGAQLFACHGVHE